MNDAANDDPAMLKARIRDLEAVLKQNDANLMMTFRLTPAASNLFGLLLSVQIVTSEMIRQRLEIATDGKVAVHRLRQQLKPWGIEIQARRNLGYWLDSATKERVKEMLRSGVPDEGTRDEPAASGVAPAELVAA